MSSYERGWEEGGLAIETIPARPGLAGQAARPLTLRPLRELSAWRTSAVAALIREAGNPYCDWLFGGGARARLALARWLERPSSELAADRVTALSVGERLAGISIVVSGADLAACRRADALATMVEAGAQRSAVAARLAAARDLFLAVAPDELYLSRIAVAAPLRDRGFGRLLMEEFLTTGRSAGFERFCLDVAAANKPAIRLYRTFGFRIEGTRKAAGMRYVRMSLLNAWPS